MFWSIKILMVCTVWSIAICNPFFQSMFFIMRVLVFILFSIPSHCVVVCYIVYFLFTGADFIKTSTGKEGVNATLMVGLVMVRAIREYFHRTGHKVS